MSKDARAELIQALATFGFEVESDATSTLMALLPLTIFAKPDKVLTAFVGRIEGSTVRAFHYAHTYQDHDGSFRSAEEFLIVAQHPMIRGDARISPDAKAFGGAAALIDTLLWIPPFTLIKAIQYLMGPGEPDRVVGSEEFDRLYRVYAASDAAAREAIPEALRAMLVQLRFQGRIELRAGALLYTVNGVTRLERERVLQAFSYAAPLLSAAASSAAYR